MSNTMNGSDNRAPRSSTVHGQADTHGRVFQQGSGTQINAESIVFAVPESVDYPWLSQAEAWKPASEHDPLELGVHRSAIEGGTAVPPYVERDVDGGLRARLSESGQVGGFVLLVGDSTAGKSRALFEAVVAEVPDLPLVAPDDERELRRAVIAAIVSPGPCIIWLENLERFAGADGLTPGLVARATASQVWILATIRTEALQSIRSARTDPGEHSHGRETLDQLLNQYAPIVVDRKWSTGEVERAEEMLDVRVREAVRHSATYGVAEYLAAGPDLLDEWRISQSAGGNPRGAALVAAAVDVARCGVTDPIPVHLIRDLHESYLIAQGGALLRPELYDDALSWALERRYGVTSLLLPTQTPDAVRVFDYLVDETSKDPSIGIPGQTWSMVSSFDWNERTLLKVAAVARRAGRMDDAERMLLRADGQSSKESAYELARLYSITGQSDLELKFLEKGRTQGHWESMVRLGIRYEDEGDISSAEDAFRQAAEAGSGHAAFHLASSLKDQGKVDEAEVWWTTAMDYDSTGATVNLAQMIAEIGREGEAEESLRSIAEDEPAAANSLGILLKRIGRMDEALDWWTRAAADGEPRGAANLGTYFRDMGDGTKAEEWYRRAVDLGLDDGFVVLSEFLIREKRFSDAEDLLTGPPASSSPLSSALLGRVRLLQGELAVAQVLFEEAIDRTRGYDRGYSLYHLSILMDQCDEHEIVEQLCVDALDLGYLGAAQRLMQFASGRDDLAGELKYARAAARRHEPEAECDLGAVLARAGRHEEAERSLRRALKGGHGHAGCLLGRWLEQIGELDGAYEVFVEAYYLGHSHVAEDLTRLCALLGRGREAAQWLRRSKGINTAARDIRKRGKSNKSRRRR